jgi:hypothetical protein
MKIKLVGFKAGKSKPTGNVTFDSEKYLNENTMDSYICLELGKKLYLLCQKSDFVLVYCAKNLTLYW